MALKLYNTLTRKKEVFKPLVEGEVRVYNCGPTVYDFAHIGNFRAYVFADLLRRYLEYSGYNVRQVMNITDVGHMTTDADEGEDKLEVGAKREKMDPWQLAEKYMNAFFEDRDRLNIQHADVYPRATEQKHIDAMIDMIKKLIDNGLAYEVNGCVYYDVTKFPAYGRLSGNTLEDLEAGKRVEVNPDKRNPQDFALWVTDPNHIMQWDSPWGRGYPGWHIECSAMSIRHLGETLDIHTGGEDNIFPHHECEIAQAEGATGKTFVKYWMHARFLLVDGRKMSKSAGNFYTIRNLVEKGYDPIDIRFALLSTHYRQQLNFTLEGIDAAHESRRRLKDFVENTIWRPVCEDPAWDVEAACKKVKDDFQKAMDDDLNISAALGAIFDFIRDANSRAVEKDAQAAIDTVLDFDRVLGVLKETKEMPPETVALTEEYRKVRKAGDYAASDKIRAKIESQGITVKDNPDGSTSLSAPSMTIKIIK